MTSLQQVTHRSRSLRAARNSLALGTATMVFVSFGCADNSKTITAPQGPRNATISTTNYGSATHVDLCVDASSPPGNYVFFNTHENDGIALPGYGVEYPAGSGNWYDEGDGGDNKYTAFNAPNGSPIANTYIVAAGTCVRVMDRTAADEDYSAGTHNLDGWSAVTMTYLSNNVGAVHTNTDCVVDLGVIAAQPNPCGPTTKTVRAFSNWNHGTDITFFFSPSLPCPAGTFSFSMLNNGDLSIIYDQFPAPNDNSYGANAVGWSNGHRFSDLVNSDHAGIQLVDPSGTAKLAFNIDYLTTKAGTPSGYASLGPFGGDGKILTGTLTPSDITFTTSLAENLNSLGYFSGGVQTVGTSVANLLANSPPTLNTVDSYTLTPAADAVFHDWNFHDTYFVTITAAKLASLGFNPATWSVQPAADQLHNSPAKTCPANGPSSCLIAVTNTDVKDKQVKVTLRNNATTDAILTALALTWPSATNGKLMQIKLDGDVIYDSPDISGGVANLTAVQLVADQNKRKINKTSSDVLTFVFEKNADTDISHYTLMTSFGPLCDVVILP